MIGDSGSIRNLLKQINGDQRIFSRVCKVISVDKTKNTCNVEFLDNVGITLNNVLLNPTSESTYVLYPKIDSTVIISFLRETDAYVSNYSEIEGYYIGNQDNSFLDVMVEFITAIKNMTIMTNQGASVNQGIINVADFQSVEDKLKNIFLK